MSSFEVYYIVEKCERQVDKIVAGPYYELLEVFDARRKLKNDCSRANQITLRRLASSEYPLWLGVH